MAMSARADDAVRVPQDGIGATSQPRLVQGTLATELGLVSSSRRTPVRRSNPHESSFGFVSMRMHQESERANAERAVRDREYRAALKKQVISEGLAKVHMKNSVRDERLLNEELKRREHDRLKAIRDEKVLQLRAEGVREARIALLSNMPVH